jgi:hypothetical protein
MLQSGIVKSRRSISLETMRQVVVFFSYFFGLYSRERSYLGMWESSFSCPSQPFSALSDCNSDQDHSVATHGSGVATIRYKNGPFGV